MKSLKNKITFSSVLNQLEQVRQTFKPKRTTCAELVLKIQKRKRKTRLKPIRTASSQSRQPFKLIILNERLHSHTSFNVLALIWFER